MLEPAGLSLGSAASLIWIGIIICFISCRHQHTSGTCHGARDPTWPRPPHMQGQDWVATQHGQ